MKSYQEILATKILQLILVFNFILLFCLVGDNFSIFKPLLIDESITAWLVNLDYQQLTKQVFINQGSSPLYFLTVKFWSNIIGSQTTVTLKIFSTLLAIITFWFLYRLLRLNFSVVVSSIVIALLLGIKMQLTLTILPIRPYSLVAVFLAVGSYYYVRYLSADTIFSKTRRDLLLSSSSFFLATICHYFFLVLWLGTITHYLLFNWRSKDLRIIAWYNIFLFGLLVMFLPHFQLIIQHSSGWAQTLESNQTGVIAYTQFFSAAPISLMIILGVGIIFYFKNTQDRFSKRDYSLRTYCLLGFCSLPTVYYLLKTFLGFQVYVHRYYFWHVIFGVILVAYILKFIEQNSRVLVLCCAVFLSVELIWNEKNNSYRLPNFQEASESINQLARADLPVLFNPGLVETYDPELLFAEQKKDYFFSYLATYPIRNQTRYLLPPNLDRPEFADYFNNQIFPMLNSKKEFLIYTSAIATTPRPQALPIPEFYYILFQKQGWEVKILNNDMGVAVIYLRKP